MTIKMSKYQKTINYKTKKWTEKKNDSVLNIIIKYVAFQNDLW